MHANVRHFNGLLLMSYVFVRMRIYVLMYVCVCASNNATDRK